MTNRELATLLGINVATISKWRNGSKPQEPQIIKLGQVLGIDVRDIVENG
jgi:transcriptional regulator with XRE-family HTH domain